MNIPKFNLWQRQLRKVLLKPVPKKSVPEPPRRWRIVKGDTVSTRSEQNFHAFTVAQVEVISGTDVGKQGTILAVYRHAMKVLVGGVNLVRSLNVCTFAAQLTQLW